MLDIEITSSPSQRYETLGDYFKEGQKLKIVVSEFGDWRYELLIAVHELIEASLCRLRGIAFEEIDRFDLAFEGDGEPGEDLKAPYRREHRFAEMIERLLAHEMDVDWKAYNEACDKVLKTQKVTGV